MITVELSVKIMCHFISPCFFHLVIYPILHLVKDYAKIPDFLSEVSHIVKSGQEK